MKFLKSEFYIFTTDSNTDSYKNIYNFLITINFTGKKTIDKNILKLIT